MKQLIYKSITTGLLPLVSITGMAAEKAQKIKSPNVIFILVDDMGFGDLSVCGQKKFTTPNIDRMAQEGMFFNNMYCGSTVSAPSRASLMTGRNTGHCSVRGNAPDQIVGDDELTLAKIFKDAGYKTGAVGKWGLGTIMPVDDPKRKGFDYFYGYINMWHAHNLYPEFLYENSTKIKLNNRNKLVNGVDPWLNPLMEGMGVAEIKNEYAPFLFDKKAASFIEKNKDDQFFLYLAYNTPHANNEGKNDGMEVPDYYEFANTDWPQQEKAFAAMMKNLDNSVGMILQQLKKLNIDENTIVMFCSDNGPHQEGGHKTDFFDSNGIYKGKKRDLYEGGIRTPFIAWWPGKIKANTRADQNFAFWDMLPTFADLTKTKSKFTTDGISILPTLTGKKQKAKHEYLYWEFYEGKGKQAIIKDNWKAIKLNISEPTVETIFELYDIKNDVEETNNVAKANPEVVKQFEELFKKARANFEIAPLFKEDIIKK
jgi:arylsulfatase A-like enzyme